MNMVRLASLFEKGSPPVAGGSLDQCQKFLDAAEHVWSVTAWCRSQVRR